MKFYQVKLFFVLLAALFGVISAPAQTSQGRFSGQVTDSSGAAVPHATVRCC